MLFLRLFLAADDARYGRPGYLNLKVIRLNSQYKRIIVYRNDGAYDTAARQNGLAVLQGLDHFLLTLLLAPHRHKDQEIKDGDHQDDRQNSAEKTAGGGGSSSL